MFRKRDGTVGFNDRGAMFGRKLSVIPECYVKNGGFETGDLTDWTYMQGDITVINDGSSPGGAYHCRAESKDGISCFMEQYIYCNVAGKTIYVTYRRGPSGRRPQMQLRWSYGSGYNWGDFNQTTEWVTTSRYLGTRSTVWLRIRLFVNGLWPCVFEFDDVHIAP